LDGDSELTLSRDDVIAAYRRILKREPESEDAIRSHQQMHESVVGLTESVINSPEWRYKYLKSDLTDYSGVGAEDYELLKRYVVASTPEAGFLIDFVGCRTDINYVHTTLHMSGVVEGLPYLSSVHAEAIEWVGTLKAVESARRRFVAAELGAGWGPWIVSSAVAARRKGITDIKLIGVEGDPAHVEYLRKHVRDYGLESDANRILQGIVGPKDGFAFFPEINSQTDWGGEAIFADSEDRLETSTFRRLFARLKLPPLQLLFARDDSGGRYRRPLSHRHSRCGIRRDRRRLGRATRACAVDGHRFAFARDRGKADGAAQPLWLHSEARKPVQVLRR
jgi:hypothetical protein